VTDAQAAEPLSKRLFGGSAVIHRQAERRPFMVVFFKAQLPKESYTEYLGRLSFIYGALEDADEALKDHPVVGRMYSPELHRRQAIESDMEFLAGEGWRDRVTYSDATKAYVERIQTVAKEFPPGFVAHQWLRYLGNVLAQPVTQRIMKRAYELEDLEFGRYQKIADPRAYLGEYHARMNSMPLSEEETQLLVDEANRAWQHQIDFTDELAADFGITATEQEAEELMRQLAAEHG
jgi:heme oxygenase (biliverdin-producing, ferredoxin)